jgi:pSer/pThr/pTyr-binding forkhead associated (FHA) protein
MPDSRHDAAASLPFLGPHWRHMPRDPDVLPMRLRLTPGRSIVELTRSGLVFGRHSAADVRLPLPDVSRRHCRFVWKDGRWQVIDLDSLNGVYVNGVLVRQADLSDGDTVRIGGFVFEVDLHSDDRTVALGGTNHDGLRRAS